MHIGGTSTPSTLPLPASYIQESYYLLGSSDEESDEDVRRSSSPGGITSSVVLVLELEEDGYVQQGTKRTEILSNNISAPVEEDEREEE